MYNTKFLGHRRDLYNTYSCGIEENASSVPKAKQRLAKCQGSRAKKRFVKFLACGKKRLVLCLIFVAKKILTLLQGKSFYRLLSGAKRRLVKCPISMAKKRLK